MPRYQVVEELQTYLVDEGVAQLPGTPQSDTIPSVWLQPRDGAPLPREAAGAAPEEAATVTLVDSMLGSPNDLEAWIEEAFIDVTVRARNAGAAKLLHRTIRGLLVPLDAHGGRKQWEMGAITVELSTMWRPEQPLPMPDGAPTYDRVASYRFQCRRKVLDGLAIS